MAKQNSLEITIGLLAKLQSAVHSIDELEHQSEFVREIKQKTNQYSKFLENRLEPIYRELDVKTTDEFIEKVGRIDDIGKEFVVTIETGE